MGTVKLRRGQVQPVWAGHPWVFSQNIDDVDGAPARGDVVRVTDPEGKFLGAGFWSPKSAIPVRLWTRDPAERLDDAAIGRRLDAAIALRRAAGLPAEGDDAYRLLNSEGDQTPGLIVDVFGDVAVVQFRTAGARMRADAVFGHVIRVSGVKTILTPRTRIPAEGIDDPAATPRGTRPDALTFRHRGFDYEIPMQLGQKTGFYLDQRTTRARVEALVAALGSPRVLDAYGYVGAIGLAASRAGASEVLSVDSSAPAVAAGAAIARKNGYLEKPLRFVKADIRQQLPALAKEGRTFDLVVVDPPKLVPNKRHLEKGRKAYMQLNRLAAPLVRRGGYLLSCSCSAAMRTPDFLRTINEGARRAGRMLTLVDRWGQPADHPTPAAFREGRYLDAALFRVDA